MNRWVCVLCFGAAAAAMMWCSADAAADRVLEGLWLGPIDTGIDSRESIDIDYLEDAGGETEISQPVNGPEDGLDIASLSLAWEVREANMADQFDVAGLWGGREDQTAYFYIYIETLMALTGVDLWRERRQPSGVDKRGSRAPQRCQSRSDYR